MVSSVFEKFECDRRSEKWESYINEEIKSSSLLQLWLFF